MIVSNFSYHFESFLRPQQIKHRLEMLLNVTAGATDRCLTRRELIGQLTKTSIIADDLEALI